MFLQFFGFSLFLRITSSQRFDNLSLQQREQLMVFLRSALFENQILNLNLLLFTTYPFSFFSFGKNLHKCNQSVGLSKRKPNSPKVIATFLQASFPFSLNLEYFAYRPIFSWNQAGVFSINPPHFQVFYLVKFQDISWVFSDLRLLLGV